MGTMVSCVLHFPKRSTVNRMVYCRRVLIWDKSNLSSCIFPEVQHAMGPELPELHTRMGYEVGGKTLGIVGMGNIGLQIAKMAHAFNMKIVYHNRNRR